MDIDGCMLQGIYGMGFMLVSFLNRGFSKPIIAVCFEPSNLNQDCVSEGFEHCAQDVVGLSVY